MALIPMTRNGHRDVGAHGAAPILLAAMLAFYVLAAGAASLVRAAPPETVAGLTSPSALVGQVP